MATALAIVIAGVGCSPKKAVSDHPFAVTQEHRDRAAALVEQMTLEEKLGQMNLLIPPTDYVTGDVQNTDAEDKIRNGLVGGLFGRARHKSCRFI